VPRTVKYVYTLWRKMSEYVSNQSVSSQIINKCMCCCRLAPSFPRCQSARSAPADRPTVNWTAEPEDGAKRRQEAEEAFDAWLRKKQREAAERRREKQQHLNCQSTNEVEAARLSLKIKSCRVGLGVF